jgi:hypothetical protein
MPNGSCFSIVITRDRAPFLRRKTFRIPITEDDGGFRLRIHQGPHDDSPVVLEGYIGKEELTTTVDFKGASRLKRRTPRT